MLLLMGSVQYNSSCRVLKYNIEVFYSLLKYYHFIKLRFLLHYSNSEGVAALFNSVTYFEDIDY